jgi:hypothetical protein
MRLVGVFLMAFVMNGCSPSTIQQALRSDEAVSKQADSQQTQARALVVTDNPYTISRDRLENE